MATIEYQDEKIESKENLSVLETLEEAGYKIPFSCRSGICQSCLMQVNEGKVSDVSQRGLTEAQKAQNYFLSCSCYVEEDISINLIGDQNITASKVIEKQLLNRDVVSLKLSVSFNWYAGQYLSLWYDETQGRSYSIASRCDESKTVELHITRHPHGLVSRWLHDEVNEGDIIKVSQPSGNCFYTDECQDKPILMVCTGTGLAPIYGVLQDALHRGHSQPIYLFSASGSPNRLYYTQELTKLAKENANLEYQPVVRRMNEDGSATDLDGLVVGDVVEIVKEKFNDLKGWKIFLCGAPEMIKQVQRHCFFQGAAVTDIAVDAFIIETPK